MGRTFLFQCKKGKFRLHAHLGIGMRFPRVFDEITFKARSGELGEELQKFLLEHPNGVLDVSNVLIKCIMCGQYEVVPDLTMYLPKDPSHHEEIPAIWKLREHYEIFAEYCHKCKYCGSDVEVFKEEDFKIWKDKLTCPYCQGRMGVAQGFGD